MGRQTDRQADILRQIEIKIARYIGRQIDEFIHTYLDRRLFAKFCLQ